MVGGGSVGKNNALGRGWFRVCCSWQRDWSPMSNPLSLCSLSDGSLSYMDILSVCIELNAVYSPMLKPDQ